MSCMLFFSGNYAMESNLREISEDLTILRQNHRNMSDYNELVDKYRKGELTFEQYKQATLIEIKKLEQRPDSLHNLITKTKVYADQSYDFEARAIKNHGNKCMIQ